MIGYRLDPNALADLDAIYEYVAARNLSAADRLMDTFRTRFKLIASHPLLGQLQPELAPDLRSLVVGSYVVFYRVTDQEVQIARVIHSARDLQDEF
jgi:toxin ParE1/3/4